MPSQGRTLPLSAPHPAQARITTDAQRGAGTLTPAEVRAAVARFLAPHEVAALAHAALDRAPLRPHLDQIKAQFRGSAGGGVICTSTARGLAVEIHRDGEERGGLVAWRLLAQVVTGGATPQRVAALDDAMASRNPRAASEAADALVLAGPAATQLDLLDALTAPDAAVDADPVEEPSRRQRTARTGTADGSSSRGRRPMRTTPPTSGGAA